MECSFYFTLEMLDALAKQQATPGETIEGFVFTPGHDEQGGPLLFPFIRIRKEGGEVYLRESLDLKTAGCPYPPPCK